MRPRIRDHISVEVLWQINVVLLAAERELKHAHSRKAEFFSQLDNVLSNQTQVLSNNRQVAECTTSSSEQFPSRRLDPFAISRRRFARRNFPTCCKASKVIQPHQVE